jgi:hypothetical protein
MYYNKIFILNLFENKRDIDFFLKISIADCGSVPALLAHARDGNGSDNFFLNKISTF